MPTQSKRGNLAIDMVVDVVWVTSFFLLFSHILGDFYLCRKLSK